MAGEGTWEVHRYIFLSANCWLSRAGWYTTLQHGSMMSIPQQQTRSGFCWTVLTWSHVITDLPLQLIWGAAVKYTRIRWKNYNRLISTVHNRAKSILIYPTNYLIYCVDNVTNLQANIETSWLNNCITSQWECFATMLWVTALFSHHITHRATCYNVQYQVQNATRSTQHSYANYTSNQSYNHQSLKWDVWYARIVHISPDVSQ